MKQLVKYMDAKKPKYGFWDGKKATLIDKENTIVRKKEWLTFLKEGNSIFYFCILLCYIPFTTLIKYIRSQWLIKTGKLIPLQKEVRIKKPLTMN